jgi:hypothetical protein
MSSKYPAILEASCLLLLFLNGVCRRSESVAQSSQKKKMTAGLGKFLALRELRLAGNFWEMGGLPDEMENLKELRVESPLLWA